MKKAKQPRKTSKASKRKPKNEFVSSLIKSIREEYSAARRPYSKKEKQEIADNMKKSFENEVRVPQVSEVIISLDEMKKLQEGQKIGLDKEFGRGFFNGMELCISILERRQPKYLTQDDATMIVIDGQDAKNIKPLIRAVLNPDFKPMDAGKEFESAFLSEHWAITLRKKYLQPGEHESNARIRDLTAELEKMFPEGSHVGHIDMDQMNPDQIAEFFFKFLNGYEVKYAEVLRVLTERILGKLASEANIKGEQAAIARKRFEEAMINIQKINIKNNKYPG